MRNEIRFFWVLAVLCTLCSCASRKKMAYLQAPESSSEQKQADGDKGGKQDKMLYEPMIQSDDLLYIVVSAENPEVAAPYNLKSVTVNNISGNANSNQNNLEAYLVDKNGEIEFPQLGKIKMGGLTRLEAVEKIKKLLVDYIQNPTVYLNIVNFKVSVLGEVSRPGSHTVSSERITLLEALSLSGDLTVHGKRDNIMVLREKDGQKMIAHVDITKVDFIHSPYYYLSQNDVIYVEPNRVKMGSSLVGPSVSLGISIFSIALGIILIAVN